MDKPTNNEDKKAWCEYGAEQEQRLAGPLFDAGCGLLVNPAKAFNKYLPDALAIFPSDIKTIRTRFNTAHRYGIDPRTAITINRKDVERYADTSPHIVLMLDIDFGDWRSLRYASLREIVRAIKLGKAKLHAYQNRTNDTRGNAKESYVLDALWFPEFPERAQT